MKRPSTPFRVEIASLPDREDVVAEIWVGDELFAELRHESTAVSVQIYCPAALVHWDLRFADLTAALEDARKRLGSAVADRADDEGSGR